MIIHCAVSSIIWKKKSLCHLQALMIASIEMHHYMLVQHGVHWNTQLQIYHSLIKFLTGKGVWIAISNINCKLDSKVIDTFSSCINSWSDNKIKYFNQMISRHFWPWQEAIYLNLYGKTGDLSRPTGLMDFSRLV